MDELTKKALAYHSQPRPGKVTVAMTKSCRTAADLSLAYTPGVAKPVLAIALDPDNLYSYTNKGNLVAVVSNGTAILGLGNLGAAASKPVMEGKAVLFKRFADIDVFDLELDLKDPDNFIEMVGALEPTFGGINLEDIKAPECFYIEEKLKSICKIPVFHDDQHGTAIIATAALLNALELNGKKIQDIRVVFNGAGAAGIACAHMFIEAGVQPENLLICDSRGVIYKGRKKGMNPEKEYLARVTEHRTLEQSLAGADVFVGVSVADCVSETMLFSMGRDPVVFALANPNPEISYEKAIALRGDMIMATGRSDYPNQVNNVLGFPFIFRGALDVQAAKITGGMKMAAARSLAALAREPVCDAVTAAYGGRQFSFGPEYIVPKPFDPRVIEYEAVAVARAACEEGIAGRPISDWEGYRRSLVERMAGYWG